MREISYESEADNLPVISGLFLLLTFIPYLVIFLLYIFVSIGF